MRVLRRRSAAGFNFNSKTVRIYAGNLYVADFGHGRSKANGDRECEFNYSVANEGARKMATVEHVFKHGDYTVIEQAVTGNRPERTVKQSGNVIGKIVFDSIRKQYAFVQLVADATFTSEVRTAFVDYMDSLGKK